MGDVLKNTYAWYSKICLFNWGYMINDNEMRLKMKNRSHRYDITIPRPEHGHKYSKYKMCLNLMMVVGIKQDLKNTWNSIYEKFKQHWVKKI